MIRKLGAYIRKKYIERVIGRSELFDSEWYQDTYGIPSADSNKHYAEIGYKMGFDPSPAFSTSIYLKNNQDVARNGINPLFHYERHGRKENRRIYPADFAVSVSNAESIIPDYIYSDYNVMNIPDEEIISNSVYFNKTWYVLRHLFSTAVINPAAHYLKNGFKKLYDPSPLFSSAGFIFYNQVIADSGINPLLYYEQNKEKALRIMDSERASEHLSSITHSRYFDSTWYRNTYRIKGSRIFIAKHYLSIGIAKGYNPGPALSTTGYLLFNGFSGNPLQHLEKNPSSSLIAPPASSDSQLAGCMFANWKAVDELRKESSLFPKVQTENKTVDVIICVHNALNDVKLCIESVIKYSNYPCKVILVNDNSDKDTTEYLKTAAAENKDIFYLENDTNNHGYTYSANIGLRASQADYCVLLNSDTIVTSNWIGKMLNCFSSNPDIGIVGPLSNTASWQSVPNLTDEDGDWAHNTLPDGYDVEKMGELIEANSKRIYPIVPLLNGFCLMISRQTIDMIGFFDEESFGRGFAEEDDYNLRAGKAGIHLAIADDTYIYHAQSKSYTDETRHHLCEISGKILREKHGEELINRYCYTMRFSHILESFRMRTAINIDRAKLRNADKKDKKLKCAFLLPTAVAGGGSNIIINEASFLHYWGISPTIINLKTNKNAFEKAYPDNPIPTVYLDSYDELDTVANGFDYIICTLFSTVRFCKKIEKNLTARIVYYIQDFEPFFFKENEKEFTEALNSYSLIEEAILLTKTQWNHSVIKQWTNRDSYIIGPSVNIDLFYPQRHFQNSGILNVTAMIRPNSKRRAPEFTYMILREVKKKYGESVNIWLFGNDPSNDGRDFAFYQTVPQDYYYTNYGILEPREITDLLSKTDIFVDFSTYQAMGLTAMEAMSCGCAVILTKFGGTSEFAINRENALLVDSHDFDECVGALCQLIEDEGLREHLADNGHKSMLAYYPEKASERIAKILINNFNNSCE